MRATEPTADRVVAWKRARREAIRRCHPDRGGSTEGLMRALAEADRLLEPPQIHVVVTHSRVHAMKLKARRLAAVIDGARQYIPAGWPGARRSIRL